MSFAALVDRARGDFDDMPGLELTIARAVRLWSLGPDDCRAVVDTLVDAGFLAWTPRRTLVRCDRDGRSGEAAGIGRSHISVRTSSKRNIFVERG